MPKRGERARAGARPLLLETSSQDPYLAANRRLQQMLDSMRTQRLVRQTKQSIELTGEGKRFMAEALQIDTEALAHPRRPVCKACLDWSERRHHLAGTLGAAVMNRFTELNWAARDPAPGSRVVNFTRTGEKRFAMLFGSEQE